MSSLSAQKNVIERPLDLGGWLVLICLPFILPLFRRGLFWCFCFWIATADASPFKRTEEVLFEKEKEAFIAFEQKEYEKAASLFKETGAFYNLGNALAFHGKYNEAIASYEKALQENPKDEDAAFNLEYLKKQLENQQKTSSEKTKKEPSSEQQETKSSDKNEQDSEQQKLQTDSSEQPSEEQQSESFEESTDASDPKDSEETTSDLEQKNSSSEKESQEKNTQEQTEWLNQIQSHPGRLLKYRLYQQYKEQK